MGERLLLAIMDKRLAKPSNHIWLYHHWYGHRLRFEAMLMDVVLEKKLYRTITGLNEAVRGFLEHSKEFYITDHRSDRNYMAFIDMVAKRAIWFNVGEARKALCRNAVMELMKELYEAVPLANIQAIEDILDRYGADYINFYFDKMMLHDFSKYVLADMERRVDALAVRWGEDGEVVKYWREYIEELRTKYAKLIAEGLE